MNDFSVLPTPETQQEMNNLDLPFRLIQNKLSIFYNPQKMATNNITDLPELTFVLQPNDPNFNNFSKLPLTQASGYQFKNRAGSRYLSKQEFVSDEDLGPPSQQFAVIQLTLKIPSEGQPAENFSLGFLARRTIWRYYILNQQGSNGEAYSVESSDIQGGFTDKGKQTIANGQEATVFESDPGFPIAMQEAPKQQVILKQGGKVLFSPLPTPSPNQIIPVEKDGQTHIYSDMYIYV